MAWDWFNASAPFLRLGRRRVRLWNLFHRRTDWERHWGVGLLQIGQRHLLFVGHCGVRALFLGETP